MEINDNFADKLIALGIINTESYNVREHNIGQSDYSKRIIQPWSIWLDWQLDPWDADIIKRIGRHKEGESEELKYRKIIHICSEKLRQIKVANIQEENKLRIPQENNK